MTLVIKGLSSSPVVTQLVPSNPQRHPCHLPAGKSHLPRALRTQGILGLSCVSVSQGHIGKMGAPSLMLRDSPPGVSRCQPLDESLFSEGMLMFISLVAQGAVGGET